MSKDFSFEDVVWELSQARRSPPVAALAAADRLRPEVTDVLVEVFDECLDDPTGASDDDALLFSHGLYLMAKWRETRAYPFVVDWLSLPDEEAYILAGDIVTQDAGRILASVFDGNLGPMRDLVRDRAAEPFCRAMAVNAMAVLAAWGTVPQEQIVQEFLELARDGLEREPGPVWGSLAVDSVDIEALPVVPELYRAYDEGLIDPTVIGRDEIEGAEHGPRGKLLNEFRRRHPPVEDVGAATRWWGCYNRPARADAKVGRNEPCPCGSGKKYKKCCGKVS